MYQTPLFTFDDGTFDFQRIAIDILDHIPDNKILNIKFDRGQGKTFALGTLAYLGCKYNLFDEIYFLVPKVNDIRYFKSSFLNILQVNEEKTLNYSPVDSEIISFNACLVKILPFKKVLHGYKITNYTLFLIDDIDFMSQIEYLQLAPLMRNNTIVTATTSKQEYFISR